MEIRKEGTDGATEGQKELKEIDFILKNRSNNKIQSRNHIEYPPNESFVGRLTEIFSLSLSS